MYAQRFHLIEQQFIARHSLEKKISETGRASQADVPSIVSTDRHGAPVAPAVRMERGRFSTAANERAEQSAPSRTERVPFGLHQSPSQRPHSGAQA